MGYGVATAESAGAIYIFIAASTPKLFEIRKKCAHPPNSHKGTVFFGALREV